MTSNYPAILHGCLITCGAQACPPPLTQLLSVGEAADEAAELNPPSSEIRLAASNLRALDRADGVGDVLRSPLWHLSAYI